MNYICRQITLITDEMKLRQTRILLYKWLILIILFVNQLMGWIVALTSQIIETRSTNSLCTIYLKENLGSFVVDYFKTAQVAKCDQKYLGCRYTDGDCIKFTRISKYFIYQLWLQLLNAVFFGLNLKCKFLDERRSIYICNTISAFINFIGALQLIQIREDLLSFNNTFSTNQQLGQVFQAMTALQIITTILQFSLFKEYNAEQIKLIINTTMPRDSLQESVHSLRKKSTILQLLRNILRTKLLLFS
ncbi:hypothetical protein pb186bvf_017946 [Paramecium bursaria]